MTHYVLGFAIDDANRVVLVRKLKPDWQVDKRNGVGGLIKGGETPLEAMVRKFTEETGETVEEWDHLFTLNSRGDSTEIFRAFVPNALTASMSMLGSPTDEHIILWDLRNVASVVLNQKDDDTGFLQDLTWILPFAAMRGVRYENMAITERLPEDETANDILLTVEPETIHQEELPREVDFSFDDLALSLEEDFEEV